MSRARHVAVIGAGIIGVLVAREIVARDPDAQVTVIDRGGIGCGATLRSAGLHFPRGGSVRVRALSAASEDFYRRLRTADPSTPIYPLPMVVIASVARAAEVDEAYLPSAKLTHAHAVGLAGVQVPDGSMAWTGDGCQYADVSRLTLQVARTLRPAVRFLEGTAVVGLEPGPDGVRLALGTDERVTVDRVLLAPGPWTGLAAWRDLTAPLGIRVKKVVALHLERRPRPDDPCVVFHDEDAFVLPLHHRGHLLLSYTCQEWDVDPDEPADGLHAGHLAQARAVLARYALDLVPELVAGRVFCDAYTPDRTPVVRALDPAGRVVFAGGANGAGYRLAPALAAEAADLLIREEPTA